MIALSNKLLSTILSYKVYIVTDKKYIKWDTVVKEDDIVYEKQNELQYTIPKDTVVAKCKNWLFNIKNVMFNIRYHTNSNPRYITIMTYGPKSNFYTGATEFEALIKLCTEVLNEQRTN